MTSEPTLPPERADPLEAQDEHYNFLLTHYGECPEADAPKQLAL